MSTTTSFPSGSSNDPLPIHTKPETAGSAIQSSSSRLWTQSTPSLSSIATSSTPEPSPRISPPLQQSHRSRALDYPSSNPAGSSIPLHRSRSVSTSPKKGRAGEPCNSPLPLEVSATRSVGVIGPPISSSPSKSRSPVKNISSPSLSASPFKSNSSSPGTTPGWRQRNFPSRTNRAASEPSKSRNQASPPVVSNPLLVAARLKLSSKDQEAMQKLRKTMLEYSSSKGTGSSSYQSKATRETSSSGGTPLISGAGPTAGSEEGKPQLSEVRGVAGPSGSRAGVGDIAEAGREIQGQRPPEGNADYTIAVIGNPKVGKSTVIRRALKAWGASHPVVFETSKGQNISSCYSTIQPGGKLKHAWKVEFLEMDLSTLHTASTPSGGKDKSKAQTLWPDEVTAVSGAVLCYDATDPASLGGVKEALISLTAESMPCVMLACKSDPDVPLQIQPAHGNSLAEPFNVGLIEVTTYTSEGKSKMRNALRWLLYKLEQKHRGPNARSPKRDALSRKGPIRGLDVAATESDASSGQEKSLWTHKVKPSNASSSTAQSSSSSRPWMADSALAKSINPENEDTAAPLQTRISQAEQPVRELDAAKLDPLLLKSKRSNANIESPNFVSLDDLFTRLLTAITSAQDYDFINAFMLTYRRFCHPRDLLRRFLKMIQEIEKEEGPSNARHLSLQRLVGALIDWTKEYPGDLADDATQQTFREILHIILDHTFMAHLTSELAHMEKTFPNLVDLDSSWSKRSARVETTNSLSLPLNPSQRSFSSSASELVLDGGMLYDYDSSLNKSGPVDTPPTATTKATTPTTETRSTTSLKTEAEKPSRPKYDADAGSRRKSFNLARVPLQSPPDPKKAIEDLRTYKWSMTVHSILDGPINSATFAVEITKMQLELFAAIRPRDVLRHTIGKEKDDPVAKAVAFFNHLSRWTSTLLLSNPKPKHRARLYERFMVIAHHLRRFNNYESLYAMISGMRETSVARLSQTHALITPSMTSKSFESHVKLMDPRGGHIHYRRAIEADLSHGISAIPILTTVLGLVSRLHSARPVDIRPEDGFVHWDKSGRIAEILSVISDFQKKGAMVQGITLPAIHQMIHSAPIIGDEDELFERSKLLEPGGNVSGPARGRNALKRFVNKVDPAASGASKESAMHGAT